MLALALTLLLSASPPQTLYNRSSPTAEPYRLPSAANQVYEPVFTDDGRMWVATDAGLYTYAAAVWSEVPLPGLDSNTNLRGARRGANNGLWVATLADGLLHFDGARWQRWTTEQGLPSNAVMVVEEAPDGWTWVGTTAGLVRLHVSDAQIAPAPPAFPKITITALAAQDDRMWVGTEEGLFVFKGSERQAFACDSKQFPSLRIWSILAEADGVVWVGTELGLTRVDKTQQRLVTKQVTKIAGIARIADARGRSSLWMIDQEKGLAELRDDASVMIFGETANIKPPVFGLGVEQRANGERMLWVGSLGGTVSLVRPQRFRVFDDNVLREPFDYILRRNDTLWLGARKSGTLVVESGVLRKLPNSAGLVSLTEIPELHMIVGGAITRETAVFSLTDSGRVQPFPGYPTDGFQMVWQVAWLPVSHAVAVTHPRGLRQWRDKTWQEVDVPGVTGQFAALTAHETADGQLWVTSPVGLFVRRKGEWREIGKRVEFNSTSRPIEEQGALWFPVKRGLMRVDIATDATRTVAMPNGGSVSSLSQDVRNGDIWVSTASDVVRLRQDQRLDSFALQDGLRNYSVSNGGAIEVDAEGRVWVGYDNGLAVLDADAAFLDDKPAPFVLRETHVNGALRTEVGAKPLSHDENTLRFDFSLLSYVRDGETRYRYQLVGLDDGPGEWTKDAHRELQRVPAGSYTLRAWAKDYAGNISGPVEAAFDVRVPPWRTWWAFVIYFGIGGLSIYAGGRARSRQLRQRAEALEVLVQQRTEALEASYKQADRIFDALKQALKGRLLADKYRLDDEIGQGGFGVVYRAIEVLNGRTVAVKVFRPSSGNDSVEALERFKLEGKSGTRFRHDNAIEVYEFGVTDDGVAFMVMELLVGRSLKQELQELGKLPYARACEVTADVCRALAAAHERGIVHRDVKPDNVFLHQVDGRIVTKVLDFGIAKLTQSSDSISIKTLTLTGAVVGTPTYMAPERLEAQAYDGRSDVYSAGIMLYELIAGRPPFVTTSDSLFSLVLMHINQPPAPITHFMPDTPRHLQDTITRTLSKNPAARPTAAELAQLLTGAHA